MQNFFLLENKNAKKIAVLIDPEKFTSTEYFIQNLNSSSPDYIFVGGSGMIDELKFKNTIIFLKENTSIPVIIFPGDNRQRSEKADGLLLLSVFQSEKKEFIVGQLIDVVHQLMEEKVPLFPTLYLLLNGQIKTATMEVLDIDKPMLPSTFDEIEKYILSAKILKYEYFYLEAGSGADKPVDEDIIQKSKQLLANECLLVGGGIRNSVQLKKAYDAGADIVVIGNILEDNPTLLSEFIQVRNSFLSI